MADAPVPLATWDDLAEGPFADLVQGYTSPTVQTGLMIEATRMCEDICDRRLTPFAELVESHRATGVDPDELGNLSGIPISQAATLAMSYAAAMGGGGSLVRHVWLREYAPRFQEFWAYSDVSAEVVLSVGGTQTAGVMAGPELDSGHLWLQLGTLCPPGSWIRITYSGGYTTVPASLARAGKLMAASLAARELDPLQNDGRHDPDALHQAACNALKPWMRDGGTE